MNVIEAPQRTERLLEKSGRITPREVLEAYEKTELKPCFKSFTSGERACAVGVLMARGGNAVPPYLRNFMDGIDAAAGHDYVVGFICGFDGRAGVKHPIPQIGFRDGKRCRKFVLSRYPEAA
jgi:hypothetical protein